MNFQFTNPGWLLLLLVAAPWTVWLTLRSDVQISAWRRWTAFGLRLVIVLALILAIAGLQWKRPQEGMNVFFLLDRSDSIPPEQQEAARLYVSKASALKKPIDKAGVLAFGRTRPSTRLRTKRSATKRFRRSWAASEPTSPRPYVSDRRVSRDRPKATGSIVRRQ